MDGPMSDKFTASTTPKGLIEELLQTNASNNKDAHKAVIPIIPMEEQTEAVEQSIKLNKALIGIFQEKRDQLENLSKLDFDGLMERLARQNNMNIVTEISDFIGLGIPKICQVFIIKNYQVPFSFFFTFLLPENSRIPCK